jgi:hypothetical protein
MGKIVWLNSTNMTYADRSRWQNTSIGTKWRSKGLLMITDYKKKTSHIADTNTAYRMS